ncbi:oxygen-binding di-iron domain-containing protein [Parachitinimonas caeni]|uniref:MBL fold metallo-hydrolase n=1 Tax=Parachitinimonas caeni TaxID=3031301 RepID=A0ABT7E382_9NEIS|nr:MBL fold metallo-hydrolase [Parachitinimonas caeni]MDK2125860.1 MBL fold metallo-hydrolase [Parachitinimonas caeni]
MAISLFNNGQHACLLFNDLVDDNDDHAVQANQFLIVNGGEGALIDPAGNMTYNALVMAMQQYFPARQLRYILASHADPDIVASLNKWMITTECKLVVSKLWSRFVPHFCTAGNTAGRIISVPDSGMNIRLGNATIKAVPAHFLHAEGNFHFFDPLARLLFSGDVGASMVEHDAVTEPVSGVSEFLSHLKTMEGFHRRYMVGNKACRLWVQMIRPLVRSRQIQCIVPQHGRMLAGQETLEAFLDWFEELRCGLDWFEQSHYAIPE